MDYSETGKRSPVIPIFCVLVLIGFVATAGGGVYLYFNWGKHFPPIEELQAQVRASRDLTEEDVEAMEAVDDDMERAGINEWLDEYTEEVTAAAEEAARENEERVRIADEVIRIQQAYLERAEAVETPQPPPAPRAVAEAKRPANQPAPARPASPASSPAAPQSDPNAQVLEEGGTIEKMNDDWLPPGVTRTR